MLKKLRASDQVFDKAITFIIIDWDTYHKHDVAISRGVGSRSTLVLINGGKEVGRLVGETSERSIKALLVKGLK